MQDVRDDVDAIQPAVERMPCDGRDDCEPEREHDRRTQYAPLERRCTRERRDDDRSDEAGSERRARARVEPDAMRLLRSAERCEDGGGRRA